MIRIYDFIVISFFLLIPLIFSGCAKLPWLKKEKIPEKIVPKEIIYTVPKWKPVGTLSEEVPTVTRVLKRYTESISAAMTIIRSNYWKYDDNFYQTLPFGISIYMTEDGELLIDPKGGKSPDDVIIKRKPNPEYYAIKQDDEKSSSIIEEDLNE
jgi:hypothetical protein